ncbi:hypothetical protein HOB87_05435 [Candidatus Woesearchaeota archaeon]|jgi:acyl carrier protein|nr:hypothetical protein [Candidatus Woesearchaeota archaeon]MBT4764431.1 hypothetical protein [bacterium]
MIRKVILDSVAEVNKELKSEVLSNLNNDTLIFENLDSVAVLDLVIEIENKLQQEYGKFIQIADETVMDEIQTPFKTLLSLTKFIESKVKE